MSQERNHRQQTQRARALSGAGPLAILVGLWMLPSCSSAESRTDEPTLGVVSEAVTTVSAPPEAEPTAARIERETKNAEVLDAVRQNLRESLDAVGSAPGSAETAELLKNRVSELELRANEHRRKARELGGK